MEENDLYGKNDLIDQERNLVKEKGSENHSPMIAPKPLPIVKCRLEPGNRHAHFIMILMRKNEAEMRGAK